MISSETFKLSSLLAESGYTFDVIFVLVLIVIAVYAVTKSNRK